MSVKIEELPSLHHLFQAAETGFIQEYVEIEETISPKVLDAITSWIQEQVELEKK